MKAVVLILSLFVVVQAQSQNNDGDELDLQISCGFGGKSSFEILMFKKIVDRNDTWTLRRKLFSGSKLEQILSVIMLRRLEKRNSIKLTPDELKKLEDISNLEDKFSLCYTCTFGQEGTVKQLFYSKNYLASYNIIEGFLLSKP